jgi:hypothetical protein
MSSSSRRSCASSAAPLFRALEESWYPVSEREEEGQLEFLVQDPDGYLLRFCQVLGSRERPSPGEH